jgi:cold shock CspA family protein
VDLDPKWRDRIERHARSWAERHPKLTRVHVTLAHGPHHRHGSEDVRVSAYESGRMIRAAKRGATMTIALRDALQAFERELSAAREEQRRILKPPGARMVGSVRRIWRDAGYGFIRLDRGREAYFHRDSLHGLPFAALRPGMPVEVELEQGEMGLQASRVFPVGQRDRV